MNFLGIFDWTWIIGQATGDAAGWFEWVDFSWLGPAGDVVLAVLLVLVCIVFWGLNLIALPGNWLAVLLLALYAWLGPQQGRTAITITPVIAAAICAVVAEILEFAAGALGAKRAGGSRRGTIMAVIGSMLGALLGAVIGLPIPLVGPVLAAILFAGIGATAGAMYGEWTDGRSWKESWAIGHAAFWGRTFGTLGKVSVGAFIVFIALMAVIF